MFAGSLRDQPWDSHAHLHGRWCSRKQLLSPSFQPVDLPVRLTFYLLTFANVIVSKSVQINDVRAAKVLSIGCNATIEHMPQRNVSDVKGTLGSVADWSRQRP